MASGATTSAQLVEAYLDRIATLNPLVNAVRCLAPDAHERAAALDAERAEGRVRGPLHGVPVLVKDNIDVAGLPTTAGALALEHSVPDRDSDLVAPATRGRRGRDRQDQPDRDGQLHGRRHAQRLLVARRPGAQPVRRQPRPQWLQQRVGGGGRARAGHRGRRHRDRGLDPVAVQATRAWSASSRPLGLVPGGGILPIASQPGLRRPDVPHRGRRRGPARRDGRRDVRRAVRPRPAARRAAGPAAGARQSCTSRTRSCSAEPLDVLRDRGAILVEVPALPETDADTDVRSTSSPSMSTPTSRPCPMARRSGPCARSSPGTRRTPTRR